MKFQLRRPCRECPFRHDVHPYLTAARAEEIVDAVVDHEQVFPCHKFTRFAEDRDGEEVNVPHAGDQFCAGLLIMLVRDNLNHWPVRLARGLGLFEAEHLQLDAPVYRSPEAMVDAYRKAGW